jgi:hypothetical protein
VVKQLVRSNCASLSPQYSSSPPMPWSSHTPPPPKLFAHLVTALARLHVNILARKKAAWRRGAHGKASSGRTRES